MPIEFNYLFCSCNNSYVNVPYLAVIINNFSYSDCSYRNGGHAVASLYCYKHYRIFPKSLILSNKIKNTFLLANRLGNLFLVLTDYNRYPSEKYALLITGPSPSLVFWG